MIARRQHGFLFIELLFVLGMLGVFAVIATHLFYRTVTVLGSGAAGDDAQQLASAVAQLRRDVSGAGDAQVLSPVSLRVTSGQGEMVQWDCVHSELRRTEQNHVWRWEVCQPIRFAADGKIVLLQPEDRTAGAAVAAIPLAVDRDLFVKRVEE